MRSQCCQAASTASSTNIRLPMSLLATLELVLELGRYLANDQHVARLIVLDLRAQQMGLEADRQALGAAGEAAELAEGALVRGKFRRHAVILVADVFKEGARAVLVDQPGQLV